MRISLLAFSILFLVSCQSNEESSGSLTMNSEGSVESVTIIDKEGSIVKTRFKVPEGFERVPVLLNTFGAYLRQLPLKSHGSTVTYYNGDTKSNYDVYHAVVDMPIGKRDLHQCADAIMRLKAEHHYDQKEYDKIHFNFTNGFRVDYSEWMKGKRIVVNGNKTYWRQSAKPSDAYDDFWKYMEIVFSYAGTLSLSKELEAVAVENMKIGDVFIIGGSPGHAVIVVDMTEHVKTGEKLFMLAQSYMPAQETQILKNPNNEKLSPWYSIDFGEQLKTPEYNFSRSDLMRFE